MAATIAARLVDQAIRHAVQLERLKSGVAAEVGDALEAAARDVEDELRRRLGRLLAAGYDAGPRATAALEALLQDIEAGRAEAYSEAAAIIEERARSLAGYEARWQASSVDRAVGAKLGLALPTAEALDEAVFGTPFEGALLSDWVAGMAPADADRIRRAVTSALVEGQTVEQAVARVRASALDVSARGAESVVRTALSHASAQARQATFEANPDAVVGVRWVSTLDRRTTLVCAGRDGQVYPVDGGPRPPAHWGCRSTVVPVLAFDAVVLARPSVTRDQVGQEDAGTTYGAWLRRQDAAFQDEVLGAQRGRLFRDGGLQVDAFTDASGRTLTLDELRREDAAAFRRAGL